MRVIVVSRSTDYSIDCSKGDDITYIITATSDFTLDVINFDPGTKIRLCLIQDGTGSRDVTLNGDFLWANGNLPTLTTTRNAIDIFDFMSTATKLAEAPGQDLKIAT